MASLGRALRRTLIHLGGARPLTDRELLHRFVAEQDQAGFEEVVRRHGAMVLRVCQRLLGHAQDAEDAFQATFLVLVRKARSLRHGDRLGPWLYGVACRVAMKARGRAARAAAHRTEATDMIPDPTMPAEVPSGRSRCAKPRSIEMPRSFSSFSRSVSVPVRALIKLVLP